MYGIRGIRLGELMPRARPHRNEMASPINARPLMLGRAASEEARGGGMCMRSGAWRVYVPRFGENE